MARVFISFEHDKDFNFVNGIRGMLGNPNVNVDFYDGSVRTPINSYNADYVKQKISEKIKNCSILLCIVGEDTHSSKWVEWEVNYARRCNKRIIFMRRKDNFYSSMPYSVLGMSTIKNWDVNLLKRL